MIINENGKYFIEFKLKWFGWFLLEVLELCVCYMFLFNNIIFLN